MLRQMLKINKVTHIASSVPELVLLSTSRVLSTKAAPAYLDPEWETAKPFEEIPMQSFRDLLPGGVLYGKDLDKIHFYIHKRYGNLVKFPAFLGRKQVVISYDPDDFVKVYRTEGPWPYRLGLETLTYWRKNVRKDLFSNFKGLVDE